MVEIYKPESKRYKSFWIVVLIGYILIFILYWSTNKWLVQVIEANPLYTVSMLDTQAQVIEGEAKNNITDSKENLVANFGAPQKFLVLKSLLKNRITYRSISFEKQQYEVGDIVLIDFDNKFITSQLLDKTFDTNTETGTNTEKKSKKNSVLKILIRVLHITTFGIVKYPKLQVLRKVVALPGDTIRYSGRVIFEINDKQFSNSVASDNFPLIDEVLTYTLADDEVFLISPQKLGLDDKIRGASKIADIKGRVVFLLGPKWGWYYPN